ncbi:hypothetical protein HanRHA438_Chr15g0711221 [Helianthus annuus]|nr:hypothetical protein HanRHA438_Chr15g0711221 [Helianthus annuus]
MVVKDEKGNEKNGPMHKNKATRHKFLNYRRFNTDRVQPTRPRAEPPVEKCPVQVTGHGPCSPDTPPCPGFCLFSLIFVTGT